MADLVAGDVTVTIVEQGRAQGGDKVNLCSVAFGDGVDTYPSGGVPLPTYPSFGMSTVLKYLNIVDDSDATGIVWKYDYTNKKLRGFIQGAVIAAAGAATLDDFALNTTTDPTASSMSLGLDDAQGAGTVFIGQLKELAGGTSVVPAQTLYVEARGY